MLAANEFRPPDGGTGAGVLFVHGWTSSQLGYLPRAEAVSEALGATCLTFDLAGHGERSDAPAASFAPRQHLEETIAAFDALAAIDGVDPARIGVCGASYGAYLTALLVGHRPIASVLLRAPALYPDSALDVPPVERRTTLVTSADALALRNLAAFSGPAWVVESEHDETIPHAVVAAYLEACPRARHEVIAGAAHAMSEPAWNRDFLALILEWAAAF